MRKLFIQRFAVICTSILMLGILIEYLPVTAFASEDSSSYQLVIADDADLLSDSEEAQLEQTMEPILSYGNVAFVTTNEADGSTDSYCRTFYKSHFGTESGTMFIIDMDNRKVWIHSDGDIYKILVKSYTDTITDNVYKYATEGDYYSCAAKAFEQINSVLSGQKIAMPMKYISNALLSLIIAILLVFLYIRRYAEAKSPSDDEILEHIAIMCNISEPVIAKTSTSKRYHPSSSGSSGSSSSSGGGGSSSGGGGSSGGGSGHSF